MRSLLVTGGAGFIGVNFVHYWIDKHPEDRVVVLDLLTYAGNRHSLAALDELPGFTFVKGDIRDAALVERLMREWDIDTVVHFAAESHVDRSIIGPEAFLETNILGTHTLLRAARRVWLEESHRADGRFHHISTDEVYGSLGPSDRAFSERTPYAPNSPYAASKAASDHLVRAYHHTYGLSVTTSNCSNNYGPFQFPEKLIPFMLVSALEGRPLPLYGDGRNVRDWLHVSDHCRAIERILEAGPPGHTYNVGGGAERTNVEVVHHLCQLLDAEFAADGHLALLFPGCPAAGGESVKTLVTYVRDRPGHDRRYAIDATKIRDELDFEPRIEFAAGLRATIRWYLRHATWWRSVQDGSYRAWLDTQYGEISPRH